VLIQLTCPFPRLLGDEVCGEIHEVWKFLLSPFADNMTWIHHCLVPVV